VVPASTKASRKKTAADKPADGVLMRVNKGKLILLAKKNPIFSKRHDPVTGLPKVIGWTPGKSRGDRVPTKENPTGRDTFVFRGPLFAAPTAATAVYEEDRAAIAKARTDRAKARAAAAKASRGMGFASPAELTASIAAEVEARLRAELTPKIEAEVTERLEAQLEVQVAEEEVAREAAAEEAAEQEAEGDEDPEAAGSGG